MDTIGGDSSQGASSEPVEVSVTWRTRIEWAIGTVLVIVSGLAGLWWLMFLMGSLIKGDGSWSVLVEGIPVSGRLGALVFTPVALGLVVTQGLLGIGLLRQRPWVRWFALLYVLSGLLTAGAMKLLAAVGLSPLLAPALSTLPTWVLIARRREVAVEGAGRLGTGSREGTKGLEREVPGDPT